MEISSIFQESSGDIFQWLRGFYYVATTGSFSQAAIEMNRSQSALTIQIQKLENEFNIKLFDHSSPKIELTYDGKIF
jgi:DNA-binding transcriptional LysR family regulator